jgi:MarR family transcriptional regulator, lower aerobic nicotinate degradation pathway regulator
MSRPIQTESKPHAKESSPSREQRGNGHYIVNEQVGYILRVAMQRHYSIFMSMMVGELTQTQFATLAKLLEKGPCSQNHLGRLIDLDAPTIKGVIDRLQARGLVASVADPAHKRRRIVSLTRKGEILTRKAVEIGPKITEATLKGFSLQERTQLLSLLDRLS